MWRHEIIGADITIVVVCIPYLIASFFPRFDIVLVLYDFAICQRVFCVCVDVGCIHPNYTEAGCVFIVFYILDA